MLDQKKCSFKKNYDLNKKVQLFLIFNYFSVYVRFRVNETGMHDFFSIKTIIQLKVQKGKGKAKFNI